MPYKTHKKYRENPENKVKLIARDKANRKIKINKPCEVCNSMEKLQRHHPDYSKPLEVKILCPKCHYKLHNGVIEI